MYLVQPFPGVGSSLKAGTFTFLFRHAMKLPALFH